MQKIKVETATCDKCCKAMSSHEDFYYVEIHSQYSKVGEEIIEGTMSVDGSGSTKGYDLCDDCYKSFERNIDTLLGENI